MIKVEFNDNEVQKALTRIVASARQPKPILEDIGEYLVSSTKKRFSDSIGPDDQPWARNSFTTIQNYLSKYKSAFSRKTGRLTKSGAARSAAKKPLIGETNSLSTEIFWQIEGIGVLAVGSSMEYAAAQQFGMPKGYAGSTKRGSPIPWGDIPARPFLGISESDTRSILDIIEEHISLT